MKRVAAIAVALGCLTGCQLPERGEGPRLLDTTFRLLTTIEEGESRLVASWFVPGRVRLEERLLRLSGRIESRGDRALPAQLIVRVEIRDLESGALREAFRVVVERALENGFRKAKKFPRSVAGDSLVTVAVEPVGSDLSRRTEINLCLDLVRKRNQLKKLASCAAGGAATTLSGIQVSVFSGRCATSGCHDSDSAQQGLILEPGVSYEKLVNVNAVQFPPDRRVRPGDADRSYLVKKLRGSAPIGGRMPLGGPFLTDAELSGIIEWIENGAADD